jgi:hypothetical protein
MCLNKNVTLKIEVVYLKLIVRYLQIISLFYIFNRLVMFRILRIYLVHKLNSLYFIQLSEEDIEVLEKYTI